MIVAESTTLGTVAAVPPKVTVAGLAKLVPLIVTAVLRVDELTSLWCLYVAMVSVLILEHFRRQAVIETRADPIPSPVLPPRDLL